MELSNPELGPSPDRAGYVRLSARVSYDDHAVPPESYWFELPEAYADSVTMTGEPWLACLLPLAARLGEPLRLPLPVDPALLDGATEVLHIWRSWFPGMSVVPIEVAERAPSPEGPARRVGAFFSGGVDAFFTVLRHEALGAARPSARIDDLITVWGFDIPLGEPAAFEALRGNLQRAATQLGKTFLDVATNFRTTRARLLDWRAVAHGPALAAVALLLEPRWRKVLVASSNPYTDLTPLGSHPMTDGLFSTSRMRIVHDGAGFSRMEKTRFLADWPVALETLHVCWRVASARNCGACAKCYRTMTALAVLGVLDRCTTFPPGAFDVRRVQDIWGPTPGTIAALREIRPYAIAAGRHDIAQGLARCVRRSERLMALTPTLRRIANARFVWRVLPPIERFLYRGLIR